MMQHDMMDGMGWMMGGMGWMMGGMGWMMGGMGLIALLVVALLIAGIVYFVRNAR